MWKGSGMGLFSFGLGHCHENWIIPLHHESRGIVLDIVEQFPLGGRGCPSLEDWPAPALRDSELGLPLQID